MILTPVETLQQLIRIPSVNPMSGHELGGIYGEGQLTAYLAQLAAELGLASFRQPVLPGRENLVMVLPGRSDVGPLLWEVHQDTVAVEGMTVEPFAGTIENGRVYGRGACDVKGGMAAMLSALSRLAREPLERRTTIVLALTVNEEYGFHGARKLATLWHTETEPGTSSQTDHNSWSSTLNSQLSTLATPRAAIVAEPTDLNVVAAHKGAVRWRCHTIGRAAHTSDPDRGANAVYAMARVVQAIERYHREVAPQLQRHPLCGGPTVCVSTISGGVGINIVPERATIEIDRRLVPGEDPAEAATALTRYIAAQAELSACQIVHDEPFIVSPGLSDADNRAWAESVAEFARELKPTSEIVAARYGTDAADIAATGVPTVVFGPGSIEQAHTADEWIAIEELELAAEILVRVANSE